MNNIDEILNNLQKQQPQFDEEAMLDSIMENLPDRRLSLLPRLVRNVSSAAAVALLIICGLQAFVGVENTEVTIPVSQYQPDYSCYNDCKTPQEVLQRYENRKNNQSITIFKQKIYEKL